MHRHDLAEGAASKARAGDIDEIEPAGLRLDLCFRPHPAQDLLRVGQEGEQRGRRRGDVRLAAHDEVFWHRFPPGLDQDRWASLRRRDISFSQGAEWKALISTYIAAIPVS